MSLADPNHPVFKMIQNVLNRVHKDLETGDLNYEPTIKLLQRQVAVADKMGHLLLKGRLYHTMGIIEAERGNNPHAEQNFMASLAAYEGLDDKRLIATMLCCLGELNRQVGKIELSADYFTRSRQMAQEAAQHRLVIYNYCNEGQLWLAADDLPRAIDLLTTGLKLAETSEWDTQIRYSLVPEMQNALAEALGKQGTFAPAWQHVRRALELAKDHDQLHQIAHAYQVMAGLAWREGQAAAVVHEYFAQSREAWLKLSAFADLAKLYIEVGEYWLSLGNVAEANASFTHAATYYEDSQLLTEAEAIRQRIQA